MTLHLNHVVACVLLAILALMLSPAHAQETREIEHQGVQRSAIVMNSESANSGPKPTWIVLHGRRSPEAPNRSGPALDALARRESIVLVYPAGLQGRWNYPQQWTEPGKVGAQQVDDVGFILGLLDGLVADKIADTKRIYVSGASNGGLLTYSLMCAAGDRIAAAAPLIANMSEAQIAACAPKRPVPAIAIAGTADRIMRYDGSLRTVGDRLASIPETLDFWRRKHGCRAQILHDPPVGPAPVATKSWRVDWVSCSGADPATARLRLYRIEGGGHTLPSLTPQSPEDVKQNGLRSAEFETSEVVWEFLKQWSLP